MALQDHLTPFKKFVIRTPLLPFESILALDKNVEQASKQLRSWFQDPIMQEALFLASPDLYQVTKRWLEYGLKDNKQQKVQYALLRYATRMAYRPTPFGLWSACSVGKLANTTKLVFTPITACKKYTRLDMQYLCALVQALNQHPSLQEHLCYSPNNSLYRIGDTYRYVSYQYKNSKRVYQYMEIAYTPYLETVLSTAREGALLQDITTTLINENIEGKEAAAFVMALIDHQVLVSQLEPAVTGPDPLEQLLTILNKVVPQTLEKEKDNHKKIQPDLPSTFPLSQIVSILQNTREALQQGDQSMGIAEKHYLDIAEGLNKIGIPYTLNRLFQTDTIKPTIDCRIDSSIPYKVLRGIEILGRLHVGNPNNNLSQFKKAFSERYGDNFMPLASVLDPETGIGYLQNKRPTSCSPFIDDINIAQQNDHQSIPWSEKEEFLLEKYLDTLANKRYTLELTQKEVDQFPPLSRNKVPNTLSVVTTLINAIETSEAPLVCIHGTAGATGTAILARFCHSDQEILALTKEIANHNTDLDPNVVYAEVLHLPEDRVGNVILRPALSTYEIPYLAQSGMDLSNQILLSDLWISVNHHQEILLWSSKLEKRVIPQLSNLHIFQQEDALPVYHFLCDLQYEHAIGLNFSWGILQDKYSFLPRVVFEDIILHPATWQLKREQYQHLVDKKGDSRYEAVRQWRSCYNMPRYVAMAELDQELFIDLDNPMYIDMFCDLLSRRHTAKLLESLHTPSNAVTQSQEGKFTNQVIFSFSKKQDTTPRPSMPSSSLQFKPSMNTVQRTFTPGSEWLYYKIYCGVQTADTVLANSIFPLMKQLLSEKYIEEWFFIRYNAPDNHIRVRLHLLSTQYVETCIQKMYEITQSMALQDLIWGVQIDTYKRELERYGYRAITLAERLFFHDSTAVTSFLSQLDEEEESRFYYGAKAVDTFLDDFHYSLDKKLHLLEKLKKKFGKEFSRDAALSKQLGAKYRQHRLIIDEVLSNSSDHRKADVIATILRSRSIHNKSVAQKILALQSQEQLYVSLEEFVSSCLHMLCNRLFKEQQRKHEMVMYDFMFRYYQSQSAVR